MVWVLNDEGALLWGAPSSLCVWYGVGVSVADVEGLAGFERDGGDVAGHFGGDGGAVDGHCGEVAVGHEEVEGVVFVGVDVGSGRFAIFPGEVDGEGALGAEAFYRACRPSRWEGGEEFDVAVEALQEHVADAGYGCFGGVEAEDVGGSACDALRRYCHEVFAGEGFEEVLQPAVGFVAFFEE